MSLWTFGSGHGTHALVIGVGHYPALPGGGGPLYAQHGRMTQLTSARASALAVADWLTGAKGYHSAAPLRSLELLISDHTTVNYTAEGQTQTVDRATMATLHQKILDWFERASAPEDRTIFYFCGHGIAAGFQCTLLLEDFGTVPAAPLSGALDFTCFHLGMDQCKAREQIFFVDACRVVSPSFLDTARRYGDPVLVPSRPTSPPRKPPILYATLPNAAAYDRRHQPSFFAEALLKAVQGAGAARNGNGWSIFPSTLYRSLSRLLQQAIAGTGVSQACTIDQLVDFSFHDLLRDPEIPVCVECQPPIDVSAYRVTASSSGANRERLPPIPRPWCLDLPIGQYRFIASSPVGNAVVVDEVVFPPYTEVVLP